MMTRTVRKAISIICAVALLMSLCVVSMVENTSAVDITSVAPGATTNLTFDTGKGLAAYRAGLATVVNDPDPSYEGDKCVSISTYGQPSPSFVLGSSDQAELFAPTASNYIFEDGVTYTLKFKWKVAAGYYYTAEDAGRKHLFGFLGVNVNDVPAGTTVSVADTTHTSLPKSTANPIGGTIIHGPVVNASNGTEVPTKSSAGYTYYTLNEATEWKEETLTFTWNGAYGESLAFWLMGPVSGSLSGSVRQAYVDDVSITKMVVGTQNVENFDIDFKNSSTGEYWAPNNHALLTHSNGVVAGANSAWKSRITADGIMYATSHNPSTMSTAGKQWHNNIIFYDPDLGVKPYVTLNEGKTYVISFEYKVSASMCGGGQIGVGYTADLGQDARTLFKDDFAACTNTDPTVDSGTWKKVTGSFTVDSDAAGKYLQFIVASGNNVKDGSGNTMTTGDKLANYTQFQIKSLNVKEYNANELATIVLDANGGNALENGTIYTKAGSVVSLPNATHSDSDRYFAGWFTEVDGGVAVDADWTPSAGVNTLYARWGSSFSYITFNNCGVVTTERLAENAPFSRPERPDSQLFFEGWYTDTTFTNKITKNPGYDCTVYAKYTNLYIPFNVDGTSAGNYRGGIIAEPGNESNNVLSFEVKAYDGAPNFELGAYDAERENNNPYILKTNTRYTISYRYKVPAGNPAGAKLMLHVGEQSAFSGDASKKAINTVNISTKDGIDGTDWQTNIITFETGDTLYYERVNFSWMDKLYMVVSPIDADGATNVTDFTVYFDDFLIIEHTNEVPEGAVGIFYETNSDYMSPSFGYAGDAYVAPAVPTLSGAKFLGWYTDTCFANEFKATTFPETSITLYAKWEQAPWYMNFDNYNLSGSSGRYNLTEENGNKILRYNLEQGIATGSADPKGVARATCNNGMGNEYYVDDTVRYTVKLKYKVDSEGFNVGGSFYCVSHARYASWTNSKQYTTGVSITGPTDGWEEVTFEFTASPSGAENNHLSIGMSGDFTAYIDDVEIMASFSTANIYGSTVLSYNTNSDETMTPVSGNPGDPIILLKPAARPGYIFKGWYADSALKNKFTETVFGKDDITVYAGWTIAKFTESFEDLPATILTQGISSAYKVYGATTEGYDKANVKNGATSIFRDGTATGSKAFSLCRTEDYALEIGEKYTLTFYVKPTNVTDAAGVINLVGMAGVTAISAPDTTALITNVGSLKAGEWQKVEYTFTADAKYIGIQTSAGNDIYFDNVTINLKGYTGSATGDASVSPFIILSMIVLAAGAILFTSKKVFAK